MLERVQEGPGLTRNGGPEGKQKALLCRQSPNIWSLPYGTSTTTTGNPPELSLNLEIFVARPIMVHKVSLSK